ncbi:MAG TPA: hypothetical protein DIW27_08900 [Cytophagales bacterium]|nr:hypothetical protein [Cytophagales bacterium]
MRTTPSDERCAQLGDADYLKNARAEARAYINQLLRVYGANPPGTRFACVRCPHDFGTYLDIRFYYDDEDQCHLKYMMDMETGCEKWDEVALEEVEEKDYELEKNRI